MDELTKMATALSKWAATFFGVLLIFVAMHTLSKWTDWGRTLHTSIAQTFDTRKFSDYSESKTSITQSILVHTRGKQALPLGRHELKAYKAEKSHLLLRQPKVGQLYLQNVSDNSRAIVWSGIGQKYYLREWQLAENDVLSLGGNRIKVGKVEVDTIDLEIIEGKWQGAIHINKNTITSYKYKTKDKTVIDAVSMAQCTEHTLTHARYELETWVKDKRPLKFGGSQLCAKHLPLNGIDRSSLQLERRNGHYYLRPVYLNVLNRHTVKRQQENELQWQYMRHNQLYLTPLLEQEGTARLKIGYTYYALEQAPKGILFTVLKNTLKLTSKDTKIKGYESIHKSLFDGGLRGFIFGLLLILPTIVFQRTSRINYILRKLPLPYNKWHRRVHSGVFKLVLSLGLPASALISTQFFDSSDFAIALLCTLVAILSQLRKQALLYGLCCCVGALALSGIDYALVLFEVSSSEHFLTGGTKQLSIIYLCFYLWLLATALPHLVYAGWLVVKAIPGQLILLTGSKVQAVIQRIILTISNSEMLKLALITGLGSLFCVTNFIFGTETGIFGFQPTEVFKCLLPLFFIWAIGQFSLSKRLFEITKRKFSSDFVLKKSEEQLRKKTKIPVILNGLILATFLGLFVFLSSDFSYFILLIGVGFSVGIWFVIARIKPNKSSKVLLTLLKPTVFLVLLMSVFYGFLSGLFNSGLENKDWKIVENYIPRILAWKEPALYPHSNGQVIKARQLLGGSDIHPATGTSKSDSPVTLLNVPEIDDDFALSGWISSQQLVPASLIFAAAIGLLLFLAYSMQVLFAWQYQQQRRHQYTLMWDLFVASTIGFLMANMIISFSTNFSVFPVMGQPFPFIGRQGSHLLGFVFPALWIITIRMINVQKKE